MTLNKQVLCGKVIALKPNNQLSHSLWQQQTSRVCENQLCLLDISQTEGFSLMNGLVKIIPQNLNQIKISIWVYFTCTLLHVVRHKKSFLIKV